MNIKSKDTKQFKAKIAKFSYLPHKELVLLIDIKVLNQITNKWVSWERDHVWVDNFIDKRFQGKYVNFLAKEYEYSNHIGNKNIGLNVFYVISIFIKKNKYLLFK